MKAFLPKAFALWVPLLFYFGFGVIFPYPLTSALLLRVTLPVYFILHFHLFLSEMVLSGFLDHHYWQQKSCLFIPLQICLYVFVVFSEIKIFFNDYTS